jgi:hypothetical protein
MIETTVIWYNLLALQFRQARSYHMAYPRPPSKHLASRMKRDTLHLPLVLFWIMIPNG